MSFLSDNQIATEIEIIKKIRKALNWHRITGRTMDEIAHIHKIYLLYVFLHLFETLEMNNVQIRSCGGFKLAAKAAVNRGKDESSRIVTLKRHV